jgi:hypothetical protein
MNTTLSATPLTAPGALIRRAWQFNRLLTLTILINLALVPAITAAAFLNPQVIGGVNGWFKPLKFVISAAIYAATFLWLLTFVRGRDRWVGRLATGVSLALLVEIGLIILQAARGVTSHFNVATPLDAAIFTFMGIFISLLAVLNLVLAIFLIFQRIDDPVVAWGLRLAVLISLLGMVPGMLMTGGPTPAQQAALAAGGPLTVVGAHSVGIADGGPGLPFLGWSTVGGDLRVGHFLGLHGMQALPLLAFALTRPRVSRRLSTQRRVALVWIGGASYAALTVLTIWQALRGQALVAPDGMTLAMLGAWLLATALAVVLTVARPNAVNRPSVAAVQS